MGQVHSLDHSYALERIAQSPLHLLKVTTKNKKEKEVSPSASNQTRDTESSTRERS
jgi:hypothetical protein